MHIKPRRIGAALGLLAMTKCSSVKLPEGILPDAFSSHDVTMHLEANKAPVEYLIDGEVVAQGARASFHPNRQPPFVIQARFPECYGRGGGSSNRLTLSQSVSAPLVDNRVISFYVMKEQCFASDGCVVGDRRCAGNTNPAPR
jgi:hypothetical protein